MPLMSEQCIAPIRWTPPLFCHDSLSQVVAEERQTTQVLVEGTVVVLLVKTVGNTAPTIMAEEVRKQPVGPLVVILGMVAQGRTL